MPGLENCEYELYIKPNEKDELESVLHHFYLEKSIKPTL